MHPVYIALIAIGCVVLGAVCGPAIHTAYAEAKVKAEDKYSTLIADAQHDLAAVKLKASNDVAQAKLDIQNDFNAMKARAESAESDLAALKRFLPGVTQPAPVVAAAPVLAPAAPVVQPAPVPVPVTSSPASTPVAASQPVEDNMGTSTIAPA